ncbi:hypothetical protein D3C85_839990 [compost metagenome]
MNSALPGRTISSTPPNPTSTATHWARDTRSFSNGTESAVTSRGARKITEVASASGICRSPVVNSRLTPTRHSARATCKRGRLVRSTRMPSRGSRKPAISKVCTK